MNIEEAATQAGIDMSLWSMGAGSLAFVEGVHGIPRDEFERFAKIIRNQALEDAKATCAGIGAGYTGAARRLRGVHATLAAGMRDGANECAAEISAMKEQT